MKQNQKSNRNVKVWLSYLIMLFVFYVSFIFLVFFNIYGTLKNKEIDSIDIYYHDSFNYEEQSQESNIEEIVVEVESIYIENEVLEEIVGEEIAEIPEGRCLQLSEQDIDMICRTVQLEAGYYSEEGQKNVTYVILNRLCSERFPNTIEEVIFAPNQFSVTVVDYFFDMEISEQTYQNVTLALNDYNYNISAEGAVYFRSNGYFDWCEYLFTDEVGHNFFK